MLNPQPPSSSMVEVAGVAENHKHPKDFNISINFYEAMPNIRHMFGQWKPVVEGDVLR